MERRAKSGEPEGEESMAADKRLFRFEKLEVWQRAADVALPLGNVADLLAERRFYRYAEQLRGAAISISNNIAEGSDSNSNKDFCSFLNIAHRSAFECANMLLVFRRNKVLPDENIPELLDEIDQICRMITALSRSLG
jgi:four helix bundle protein